MQDQWCCGQCNNEASLREALFSLKRCFFAHAIEIHYLLYEFFPVPHSSPGYTRPLFPFGWTSLIAQTVKHLPITQETQVWPLGREDPLEKEMATHSSILAWKIPWTEECGRLQPMGSQRVGHDLSNFTFFHFGLTVPWYTLHHIAHNNLLHFCFHVCVPTGLQVLWGQGPLILLCVFITLIQYLVHNRCSKLFLEWMISHNTLWWKEPQLNKRSR